MNRGKDNPLAHLVEDGDVILDLDRATDADIYDLYDLVWTRRQPDATRLAEVAGMLLDDGVLAVIGGRTTGFARHFREHGMAGNVAIGRGPIEPERDRINAEKRRRRPARENPRHNPAVGGMDWDDAVRMMRSDLRGVRMNDDEAEDFMLRRVRMVQWLVGDRPWLWDSSARLRFPLVPAARLRKAWLDYGRTGEVRDPKGVDKIAARVLDNIALLHATNALGGHSEEEPSHVLEDAGFEDIDPSDRAFNDYLTDPDTGGWYVSDYGLPYLVGAYALILRAGSPEEQLLAVDKALNVVHQRSDLASWFVEGGTRTLNEVATQR